MFEGNSRRKVMNLQSPRTMPSQGSRLGGSQPVYLVSALPVDVLEHICNYLDVQDVVALSRSCKLFKHVASFPRVWAGLVSRAFLFEELPQDLGFLRCGDTALIRSQFWQLTRQRPAFLSDAPRTSENLEHTGSRFRKVLHLDGRRDFNFTTVFRNVPPGQYNVVWRIMLQPGYVRGYCSFRAVFSRPADPKAAVAPGQARPKSLPTLAAAAAFKQRFRCGQLETKPAAEAGTGSLRPLGCEWAPLRRYCQRSRNACMVAPVNYEDAEDLENVFACGGEDAAQSPTPPARAASPGRRQALRWVPSCMSATPAGPTEHSTSDRRNSPPDGDAAARINSDGRSGAAGAAAAVSSGPATGPKRQPSSPFAIAASHTHSHPHILQQSLQIPQQLQQSQEQPQQPQWQQQQQQQNPQQQSDASTAPRNQHPEIEPVMPQAARPPTREHHRESRESQARPPQALLQPQPAATQRAGGAGAAAAAAHGGGGSGGVREDPQPQLLQRAMGQLATASAKRDAALAGSSGGPRYVPQWLALLWGSHASAWRQLDPSGPLGHGAWRSLHVGTLTVRRAADAHLHGVMVQLRPSDEAQQAAALPPGEARWRGALVDFVELVPVRQGPLLGSLLPSFLQRGGTPVVPEMSDVVVVPRL